MDEVSEAAFSPDGKRIAIANNDDTIMLWNAETGQKLLILKDHKDQAGSVAFTLFLPSRKHTSGKFIRIMSCFDDGLRLLD